VLLRVRVDRPAQPVRRDDVEAAVQEDSRHVHRIDHSLEDDILPGHPLPRPLRGAGPGRAQRMDQAEQVLVLDLVQP
jgi:hypothetical protein